MTHGSKAANRSGLDSGLEGILPWGGAFAQFPAAALTALAVLIANSALAATRPPNVLLVLMDDMAWASSSVQMDPNVPDSKSDYHRTPRLEQLAQEGMVFSRAYAAGSMCSPTRVALMTGKSPAQLQTTDVRHAWNYQDPQFQWYQGFPLVPPQTRLSFPDDTTLPEAIKNADPSYRASFYGKFDWQPNMPYERFDSYNDLVGWRPTAQDPRAAFFNTNNAMSFMESQVQANRPFFTIVAHDAVKQPSGASLDSLAYFQNIPKGQKHRDLTFAAMHRDMDLSVGMLMDKIESLGIEDNTYIVFTSDHGASWDLGNNITNSPLFGGKGTLYEGGIRIPLLIKGPGVTAGAYSDVPVTSMDVFSTILDMVGNTKPLPAHIEGASFKSVLQNGGQLPSGQTSLQRAFGPNGELFFHYPHYTGSLIEDGGGAYHYQPVAPLNAIPTPESAIIDGDYKLVRFYGEEGGPDKLFLFNISQNIAESANINSPVNLASQYPEKVQQLSAKLDAWLEGVDASLPFDVSDPAEMVWDASAPGSVLEPNSAGRIWRTVNDLDSMPRELWFAHGSRSLGPNGAPPSTVGATPARIAAAPYQPGLPKNAFHFDGDDGFSHEFFQVSDPVRPNLFDADHSATIESWVRFDSLAGEQLLFESGRSDQGISLTLGDADGDSIADELRFRILGKSGNQLTVTSEIDKFADPTEDFIQITAVVNDSPTNRYAEIYVNGAIAGRVEAGAGSTPLDWDHFAQASMGRVGMDNVSVPDTIGGAAGTGPLPFTGGNLHGDIAVFKFANTAMTASDIRTRYNARLNPVSLGIQSFSEDASTVSERPSNVSLGTFESSKLRVIQERNDMLAGDLFVDAVVNGPTTITSTPSGALPELTAGVDFTSYLLHFDPVGASSTALQTVTGSITFAENIIGIVASESRVMATDSVLGSIGDYGLTGRGLDWNPGDFLSVAADQRTLTFQLSVPGDDLLQFRVLTDAATLTLPPTRDFNHDGVVDSQDLVIWQDAFGASPLADADGDGDSDGSDFLAWQRNLGSTVSVPAAAVPEAGGLALAISGLLLAGSLMRSGRFARRSA